MKRCASMLGVVGVLVVNMLLIGCGGGGDDTPTATGTWGFADPTGAQDTMTLAEAGGAISGTSTRGATVSGTRTGANANISLRYPKSYTITIVVVINGDRMSGTASDSEGGSGTFEAIREDSGGDITPGTYIGTEHITISMPGVQSFAADAPIQFSVNSSGEVMLPTVNMNTSGGGVNAHTMISHTQTGNSFSLTASVNMGGYGSLSYTYSGTVNGNLISGTITGSGMMGMTIGGTFQATRQ